MFPKEFMYGFSMSSFQYEMGLPGSESPWSDWWKWVHDLENISVGLVSGDLPENGPGYWVLYREDHDLADWIGFDTARLCIDWSRVFPRSTEAVRVDVEVDDSGIVGVSVDDRALEELDRLANRGAIEHYRRILGDWKSRGKKLILNLYHWTTPLWLHDPVVVRVEGFKHAPAGWVSDKAVVEFVKYAAYIAWKLGDLVDLWCTMNEPTVVYKKGYIYVKSGFPPGVLSFSAAYTVARHLAEAHARAYDVVKEITGKPVGIIHASAYIECPKCSREYLEEVVERECYSFIDSIHYGRAFFLERHRRDLEKKIDWLGLNYYSRLVVEPEPRYLTKWRGVEDYGFFCRRGGFSRDGYPCSDFGWEIYPRGIYYLLKKFWNRYKIPLIVTENGLADSYDRYRSMFIVSHLYHIHRALMDGVDVRGYLHWSLLDNYEWAKGYKMRFGLIHVDYKTKKRYIRPSTLVFKEIVEKHEIPEKYQHMIIDS